MRSGCRATFQGDGRHDNPEHYGCLYVAERAESAVVEQLARFRGNVLVPGMLRRRGLPLALAAIELDERARLVDLDGRRSSPRAACGRRWSRRASAR